MVRKYAAIVLAAGFLKPMQGCKPLLTVGGETITDHVIATFLSNNIDVLLVTGWKSKELLAGIKHQGITAMKNPDYERDMLSSIQAGASRFLTARLAFFIVTILNFR